MTLASDSRLGPYEIVSPLGAGGMGEVWRARDTRLGREVAIKVLPPEVSADTNRLRRFEKEAQAASSLNHPNIVTIHEIERIDSTSFIVMELVEGKTLRDVVADGPLTVRKILGIAVQIADGLAGAHSAGIVHRDLKPENVMVTKEGLVKILDFGLSKLVRPDLDGGQVTEAATVSAGTKPGIVMGTVGYMSPEQASGHPVDFRSDQFSFGSILFEMATGRPAFRRATAPQTMAAIIQDEPEPVAAVNPKVPPPLRWIIERCLAKDARERYASTEDLAREWAVVRDHLSEASASGEAVAAAPTRPRRRVASAAAIVAALLVAALSASAYLRARRTPASSLQVSILPPDGTTLSMTGEDVGGVPAPVAVSPDGKRLVFGAIDGDRTRLYVRALDSFAARPLQGTESANYPFWSPDGGRIGFFTPFPRGQLKVINAAGGPVETIVDTPNPRGGSWGRDGTILFTPKGSGAIFRVSEKGGPAVPVTFPAPPGAITHRYPSFLPDGRHFLYLSKRMPASEAIPDAEFGVFLGSTASKETRRLLPDISSAIYAPPGYVLFVREGALVALPFDAAELRATGAPVPIAENVEFAAIRTYGVFSASSNGVLAFRVGAAPAASRLTWFDRAGKVVGAAPLPPAVQSNVRLSPDERRALVWLQDPPSASPELWTLDLTKGTRTPLTHGNAAATGCASVFSPDGTRVVLPLQGTSASENLSVMDSNGEGPPDTLLSSPEPKNATDWSRDGRFILFHKVTSGGSVEIWVYSTAEKKVWPFRQGDSNSRDGVFSPDGRWVAYVSGEAGQTEIFVRPFPGPGARQQLSRGGRAPIRWSRDGREIVYVAGAKLVAVDVKDSGKGLEFGEPRPFFQLPSGDAWMWDISPDHQRILVAVQASKEKRSPPISVVTNWAAEIRR